MKAKSIIKKDLDLAKSLLENKAKSCFEVKSMNQWIDESKHLPNPKMLCGELWHENELCILFANTNLGKSAFAIQIAQSICSGVPITGLKLEARSKGVLFLDFELSEKQLEKRYSSDFENHFSFSDNFYRGKIKHGTELPDGVSSFEAYLCESLKNEVTQLDVDVIIVDNMSYLNADTEKSKDALTLMKFLNKLKHDHHISILVLAHTPKIYRPEPITNVHLKGSMNIMNFCDSCFAIGKSEQEPSIRYIKQIKERFTEKIYHSDNVLVFKLENEDNFLKFNFIEYGIEHDLLKLNKDNTSENINNMISEMVEDGKTNTQIGLAVNLSEGAIRKRRKKLGL